MEEDKSFPDEIEFKCESCGEELHGWEIDGGLCLPCIDRMAR